MVIESVKKGDFRLFRINQDLTIYSDLSILKEVIQNALLNGEKYIALRFSPTSIFSSQAVTVLIACIEMVKECGGKVAIVKANPSLKHLLSIIDLENAIHSFESEVGLGNQKVKVA
jgi:anti-anti-sigma regulatory factor